MQASPGRARFRWTGWLLLAALAALTIWSAFSGRSSLGVVAVSALVGAAVLARNLQPRRMRASRLWIVPAVLIALTLLSIAGSFAAGTQPLFVVLCVAAGCVLGLPFGILRGRHTRVRTTERPGVLIVEPAIIPLLIWVVAFIVRFAIRALLPHAGPIALAAGDGFLAFAVTSIVASRLVIAAKFKELTTA